MAYKSAIFTSHITAVNWFRCSDECYAIHEQNKSKSKDKVVINNISFKNRIKLFGYKALENAEDNKQFSVLLYGNDAILPNKVMRTRKI